MKGVKEPQKRPAGASAKEIRENLAIGNIKSLESIKGLEQPPKLLAPGRLRELQARVERGKDNPDQETVQELYSHAAAYLIQHFPNATWRNDACQLPDATGCPTPQTVKHFLKHWTAAVRENNREPEKKGEGKKARQSRSREKHEPLTAERKAELWAIRRERAKELKEEFERTGQLPPRPWARPEDGEASLARQEAWWDAARRTGRANGLYPHCPGWNPELQPGATPVPLKLREEHSWETRHKQQEMERLRKSRRRGLNQDERQLNEAIIARIIGEQDGALPSNPKLREKALRKLRESGIRRSQAAPPNGKGLELYRQNEELASRVAQSADAIGQAASPQSHHQLNNRAAKLLKELETLVSQRVIREERGQSQQSGQLDAEQQTRCLALISPLRHTAEKTVQKTELELPQHSEELRKGLQELQDKLEETKRMITQYQLPEKVNQWETREYHRLLKLDYAGVKKESVAHLIEAVEDTRLSTRKELFLMSSGWVSRWWTTGLAESQSVNPYSDWKHLEHIKEKPGGRSWSFEQFLERMAQDKEKQETERRLLNSADPYPAGSGSGELEGDAARRFFAAAALDLCLNPITTEAGAKGQELLTNYLSLLESHYELRHLPKKQRLGVFQNSAELYRAVRKGQWTEAAQSGQKALERLSPAGPGRQAQRRRDEYRKTAETAREIVEFAKQLELEQGASRNSGPEQFALELESGMAPERAPRSASTDYRKISQLPKARQFAPKAATMPLL